MKEYKFYKPEYKVGDFVVGNGDDITPYKVISITPQKVGDNEAAFSIFTEYYGLEIGDEVNPLVTIESIDGVSEDLEQGMSGWDCGYFRKIEMDEINRYIESSEKKLQDAIEANAKYYKIKAAMIKELETK